MTEENLFDGFTIDLNFANVDPELIKTMTGEQPAVIQKPGGKLVDDEDVVVAAGGWCMPSEQLFDINRKPTDAEVIASQKRQILNMDEIVRKQRKQIKKLRKALLERIES